MKYKVIGDNFPVVECTLDAGEKMITQSGAMAWMDSTISMETSSNGGLGKVLGRMFTNETLFQNIYTSHKDDSKITFGTSVPGSIKAIKLEKGQSIICQKSAFLASYGNIELSTFFNRGIGVGFFGGEGFIMQRVSGEGIVFIEVDGSSKEIYLEAGEKLVLSTGYLVLMDQTCSIDIQTVKGVKNIFLGGEGLFHTVVTGPGKVLLQTMPLSNLAKAVSPYFINTNPNNR